ncbi:GNAT family N-acetyltransferase [Actinokineospora pegani]|uniref:GNAT family N-acetyltransferase n=1 Tax=Actinokineospora pegani TaxID=2654637 RepID=UPI0012EA0D69|nr:GNAT family N-acetyltransferase [Actinokineospora pegani]
MEIELDDLSGPEIAEFLAEHVAQMRETSPLESKHALDLAGLREPGVTFWSARVGGRVVGCAAVQRLDDEHGEVKSMRTRPGVRRSGVGRAVLGHLVAEARGMGFRRLSLETGSAEFFAPARALYEKFGFAYCAPFADYVLDPHSVFMTLDLSAG